MSKGLEALDGLRFDVSMSQDINYIEANKECDIIEKELKALEIIKNLIKFGDDLISILDFDTYEEYCKHSCDYNYELTEEEFNLLKEVFCNEWKIKYTIFRYYEMWTNIL